jgi:hypothetical protein
MSKIDYSTAPQGSQKSYQNYYQTGTDPGDFIRAVLANDLMAAVKRADATNLSLLKDHVNFIYNALPFACSGNLERVSTWLRIGGASEYFEFPDAKKKV